MGMKMDIKIVQEALRAAGFDPGPVDGVWGKRSVAAMKAFQRSRGLAVTGKASHEAFPAEPAAKEASGYAVEKHVLTLNGKPVAQRPSPNRGRAIKPSLLVLHYTGASSTSSAINTLTDRGAKVSAHLVIAPDGAVTQLLPLDVAGWHAGASKWKGKPDCNSFSIGIEMVNAGLLGISAVGNHIERLGGKVVRGENVLLAPHKNEKNGPSRAWAIYPVAQFEAAVAVSRAICEAYGIKDVVGHDDISPARKIDPGPAWPMGRFESLVIGRA